MDDKEKTRYELPGAQTGSVKARYKGAITMLVLWAVTIIRNLGDPSDLTADKVPEFIYYLVLSGLVFLGIGYAIGRAWEAIRDPRDDKS